MMYANRFLEFLEWVKQRRSRNTYETYYYLLLPFHRWMREKRLTVDTVTDRDIYAYLNSRDWSNSQKNKFIAVIKKFFDWYSRRIPINDPIEYQRQMARIACIKEDITFYPPILTGRKNALTYDELVKLLRVASEGDRPTIYLLAYFGLRKSELFSLTPDDLIPEMNAVDISKVKLGKTKQARTEKLRLYYNDYVKEVVFPAYFEDPIRCPKTFNARLVKYSKILGFRLFPHQLRGTFNTEMRRILEDDILLKVLMGHTVKRSDMTARYLSDDYLEEEKRKAMIDFHYMTGLRMDGTFET